MIWADGTRQGESIDLLRALDQRFPGTPPLFPAGYEDEVHRLIDQFRACFPKRTRPSSRAAFLFQSSGTPIFRSEFEKTLDATDAILAEHGGPFFLGTEFTAADCAWAPFLERYSVQLPLLHQGLDPRSPERPHLAAWYTAIETKVPAYARCQGDAHSWAKVLEQAGFGNGGMAPDTLTGAAAAPAAVDNEALANWEAYAVTRPHVARNPAHEAAAKILRNRVAIANDMVRVGRATSKDEALRGLHSLVEVLASGHGSELSDLGRDAARYFDSRMCVPRDMGRLPARAIRLLAQ